MKRFKKFKNDLIYVVVRCALAVAGFLPLPVMERLLGAVGTLAYYLAVGERHKTLKNLTMAYGEDLDQKSRKRLARNNFKNIGINAATIMRMYVRADSEEINDMIEVRGLEHLHAAQEMERGVLMISTHIGAFDLIPGIMSREGIPLSTVGAKIYDKRLHQKIVDSRSRQGNEFISRKDPPRKILRALRNKRVVGILIDQDTKVARCFVPFFGKDCATPVGPAKIAKSSGAPVVFAYIFRDEKGKHIFTISPVVDWIEKADKQEELVANTAHWTTLIEKAVRAHPEQWVWMHERWKRRPEQEL